MNDRLVTSSDGDDGPGNPPEVRFTGVDSYVSDIWTPEQLSSWDKWSQCDLMPFAPFFWAGPVKPDAILNVQAAEDDSPVVDAGNSAPWGLITSQTCDISSEGPGLKHPFIQVSPVVRVPKEWSTNFIDTVRKMKVTYMALLSAPPADGDWVVDLRVSFPISKAMLVDFEPRPGFASERDSLAFSEHFAARGRRPALHDVLSESVPRDLDDYIKTSDPSAPEWWQHVEQVRILVQGDRLHPSSVKLIICEEVPLTVPEKMMWRNWKKRGRRLLSPYEIEYENPLIMSLDKLPARLYRDSVSLRIEALGRPARW